MGLLKQLLKPFSRKTTRPHPISRKAQRVRLMVETLEDRLAPAITTSFDAAAHELTVNLGAVGDHAYLRVNAGNIAVGTTDGGNNILPGQAGVTSILIKDTGTNAGQAVTFSASGGGFTQNIQTSGIESAELLQTIAGTVTGDASIVTVMSPGQIQHGIDVAASGALINVAAGSFTEVVQVNKSVTLQGNNAGISAGNSSETRVAATTLNGAFSITANKVTIDGFDIVGGTTLGVKTAVLLGAGIDSPTIQNDVLTGTGTGSGIVPASGGTVTNIMISDDNISHWATGIADLNTSSVDIVDNLVQNNSTGISTDTTANTLIQGNMIVNNQQGIGVGASVTQLIVNANNIIGNNVGLQNHDTTSTVSAVSNFWASPLGPTHPANSGGNGDSIVEATAGSVTFQPFLTHVALPFLDQFTAANGSSLSKAWVTQTGSFSVQGNRLAASSAAVSVATLATLTAADVSIQADISVTMAGSPGLIARATGLGTAGEQMYWAGLASDGQHAQAQIWKKTGGSWSMLVGTPIGTIAGSYRFEVAGSQTDAIRQ